MTPSLVEHETIECPAELLLSARTRLGNNGAHVKTLRERAVILSSMRSTSGGPYLNGEHRKRWPIQSIRACN